MPDGSHINSHAKLCANFLPGDPPTTNLRLIIRFLVRLWRQQPISSTLSRTNEVPETTPIRSSKPDMVVVFPVELEMVVGSPPNEDAGWEGGGGGASECVIQSSGEMNAQPHLQSLRTDPGYFQTILLALCAVAVKFAVGSSSSSVQRAIEGIVINSSWPPHHPVEMLMRTKHTL